MTERNVSYTLLQYSIKKFERDIFNKIKIMKRKLFLGVTWSLITRYNITDISVRKQLVILTQGKVRVFRSTTMSRILPLYFSNKRNTPSYWVKKGLTTLYNLGRCPRFLDFYIWPSQSLYLKIHPKSLIILFSVKELWIV